MSLGVFQMNVVKPNPRSFSDHSIHKLHHNPVSAKKKGMIDTTDGDNNRESDSRMVLVLRLFGRVLQTFFKQLAQRSEYLGKRK